MKKIVTISLLLMMAVMVSAQDNKRFSPEKFEADLRCFITKEASLTPQEADKLFPVFREMRARRTRRQPRLRHGSFPEGSALTEFAKNSLPLKI